MLNDFNEEKYPTVTIQGVLLASNILYLSHGSANIFIIFSMVLILSLFLLQALNPRFYYYFPANGFSEKRTANLDTYLLYLMTFFAFVFFVWGISNSFFLSIFFTLIIILPSFIWNLFFLQKVRNDITKRLKKDKVTRYIKCPYCGGDAVLGKKIFSWNKGYQIIECVKGCKKKEEGFVKINIG